LHKQHVITGWLEKIKPNSVVDLGANTGKFSFIASKFAGKVVALESDDSCLDTIENQISELGIDNMYPIVMDLAQSTSNIGALNKEINSIYTRGQSEIVLALAIVHHLHISDQLSFKQIAELIELYSLQYSIIEFVPKTDSKVQILMQDKTQNFSSYTEENFLNGILEYFTINEVIQLEDSGRKLFLLEKRN
jgi:hypothetical protein